jgi:periplasmic copper chaperone A
MTTFRSLRAAAIAAALIAGAFTAQAHDYKAGELKIGHPWARPTVAGQVAGGAFLKLDNTGKSADRLLGGSTTAAERVELHSMSMEGDVMKMRQVGAIDIPAGQSVELKPGAFHIMLMGLKAPLQEGAMVPLTLKFEKAGEVKVDVKVEAAAPGAHAEHKH